jgi:gluconolactonase
MGSPVLPPTHGHDGVPNGIRVWNSKGVHIGTVLVPHGIANLTWGELDYFKLDITARNTIYILPTKTRGILGYLK